MVTSVWLVKVNSLRIKRVLQPPFLISCCRGNMKSLNERLLGSIVIKEQNDCWEWTKYTDGRYGLISIKGKEEKAHRVSYSVFVGDVGSYHVCHKCDNTLCINPSHLFLGTSKDNMKDMVKKGRHKGKHKYPIDFLIKLQGKGIEFIKSLGYSVSHASRLNRGLVGITYKEAKNGN